MARIISTEVQQIHQGVIWLESWRIPNVALQDIRIQKCKWKYSMFIIIFMTTEGVPALWAELIPTGPRGVVKKKIVF